MKRIFLILISIASCVYAGAQSSDTTAIVGAKLDFDQPVFLLDDYFSSVKYHFSSEGRKQWRPEFSLRTNVLFLHGSIDLTAGIRTSPNKVFGIGGGWGQAFLIFGPEPQERPTGQCMTAYLYHRHYVPLGHRQGIFLYSDLACGGRYLYQLSNWYVPGVDGPDVANTWSWWFAWQPGITFSLWGKSNAFVGLSLGTTFGLHLGIAI